MNLPLLLLVVAMLSSITKPQPSQMSIIANSPECKQWVDSVYNSLSERERVAQLFIPHIVPANAKGTIKTLIGDNCVGGLLFTKGSLNDYVTMANYAQSVAKVPVLMTLDGEWGPAMRVPQAPRFPKNMALGAISDEQLLYDYGREVARECRAMGIHVDFAPVLDVNSNPNNPVIGQRSFGEDPDRVSRLGTAFSRGLESGAVMAVGKHFPGHGDTNADSHKALPVVDHSRATLDSIDLVPFADFIHSGCNGIMVGHLSVPALDASGRAASLSRKITTGLLKDEMGFKGLVFTDGLGMEGAATEGNRCVAAIKAGADIMLCPPNTLEDIKAVLAAVKSGEIPAATIEASCRKLLAYKYALGIHNMPLVDVAKVDSIINAPEAVAINTRLADAAVTVLRNDDNILPLSDLAHNSIAVVNIGSRTSTEFDALCRKYADVDVFRGSALNNETLRRLREYRTVIAAVYTDSLADRNQLEQLKQLQRLVTVFMVNPYKMAKFKSSLTNAKAIVIAYDDTKYTQRAAAKAIFGGIDVDGTLPVNLPGLAPLGTGIKLHKSRLGYSSPVATGMNPRLEAQIDSAINSYLAVGAFPGCQIVVAHKGDIVIDKSYGLTTKGGDKVTDATLYDLASVSKAVGTLPGVMKAYDLGLFDLDEPASKHIAGLRVEGKDDITPRMLLYHETGIPAALNLYQIMIDTMCYQGTTLLKGKADKLHPVKIYKNLYGVKDPKLRQDILSSRRTPEFDIELAKGLYMNTATRDTVMNRIYNSKVRDNRKFLYSCLNFCLLMDLEQNVTGQPHQQWVTDSVWAPIGAYGMRYRAADSYPLDKIAYTEDDNYLRKQHLHGYVHDELAAFSGGVQGNAGVFGTATDIAKLCQLWLNDGKYGDAQVYTPETSRLFTTSKTPNSRRGLGFDKPDKQDSDKSPTCEQAGAAVYGHTGFTGTCFWVDPEQELIYVFLSNRVDPTRSNDAFAKLSVRGDLFDLIYDSLK